MSPPAQSFPAFEDWRKMSEREQDALLDRLEAARRRRSLATRVLIGFSCAAVGLAAAVALLTWGNF